MPWSETMKGKEFVSLVVNDLKLDISPATKNQWNNMSRNAFRRFERQILHHSIVRIVEFHEFFF